jgi:predicted ATPase
MIRSIEAHNLRCLRHACGRLQPVTLLAGPNGVGLSTFLDVVRLVGDLATRGLGHAVSARAERLSELFWRGEGSRLELAVELAVPDELRRPFEIPVFDTCRYEVALGLDADTTREVIVEERMLLLSRERESVLQPSLFEDVGASPSTVLSIIPMRGVRTVLRKVPAGHDNYYDESGAGWDHSFTLGPAESILANLPCDETAFPIANWLRRTLRSGVRWLDPDPRAMRVPSPPGDDEVLAPDGSNLASVADRFRQSDEAAFRRWVAGLRGVFGDLAGVEPAQAVGCGGLHLVFRFAGGHAVPSWLAADSMLRLAALMLVAHAPSPGSIWFVDGVEAGLGARGVEAAVLGLLGTRGSQVVMATHFPGIADRIEPANVLRFERVGGETRVVGGAGG